MPRMSGGSSQWEVDRVDDRWPLNVGSRRRENRPVYANTGHSPMTGHMAEANHTSLRSDGVMALRRRKEHR
jgi:hypothetical protein